MDFFRHDREGIQSLTDDIFLKTLAARICEKLDYNISLVDPALSAISSLHLKQVKSSSGHHQKDLDFFSALRQTHPEYVSLVREAQEEVVSTLKRTHDDRGREQVYKMLEKGNSATFGQEISMFMDQAMRQKLAR